MHDVLSIGGSLFYAVWAWCWFLDAGWFPPGRLLCFHALHYPFLIMNIPSLSLLIFFLFFILPIFSCFWYLFYSIRTYRSSPLIANGFLPSSPYFRFFLVREQRLVVSVYTFGGPHKCRLLLEIYSRRWRNKKLKSIMGTLYVRALLCVMRCCLLTRCPLCTR